MNRDVIVNSPAKINIHLDIKSRRPDGFHDIISLFHKVDLCDEITISSLKDADNCSIHGDFDCLPGDNLIIRAAAGFLDRTGLKKAYNFGVSKKIPSGAGLGGGSGNAAVVLDTLNRINGTPLSRFDLCRLGETLGSDVPFFLGGPAALVTGRGENLMELTPLSDYEAVLVVPEISISTKDAYELFDREGRVRDDLDIKDVREAYNSPDNCNWPFYNSFWEPISMKFPVLSEVSRLLKEERADYVSLSGTGSAVFGLFSCKNRAEKGFERLKNSFTRVWKIKLLA